MKCRKHSWNRPLRVCLASSLIGISLSGGSLMADEPLLALEVPPASANSLYTKHKNNVEFRDPTVSDGTTEIVNERYPDGTVKIRREMKQDASGSYIRHGEWKEWDEKGNLIAEGQFDSGERHGVWTRWYRPNEAELFSQSPYNKFQGPYISQAEFKKGQLHGKWVIYDRDQRKISEWEFVDGIRHGLSQWWHAGGQKLEEITFHKGEIDGYMKVWNATGEAVTDDVYQQGRKLALKTETYPTGNKKTEGMYLHARYGLETADDWWNAKPAKFARQGNDERHGKFTSWYRNGQKEFEGTFKHNMRVGEFTHWYTNGQKMAQGAYVDGKTHGAWTWWHENGQKSSEGHYVMGEPRGPWAFWKADGQLTEKADFSGKASSTVVQNDEVLQEETASKPERSVLYR